MKQLITIVGIALAACLSAQAEPSQDRPHPRPGYDRLYVDRQG